VNCGGQPRSAPRRDWIAVTARPPSKAVGYRQSRWPSRRRSLSSARLPMSPDRPQLRNVGVAAAAFGVPVRDIVTLVHDERLAAYRIGHAVHVDLADVAQLLGRSPGGSAARRPPRPHGVCQSLPVAPMLKAAVHDVARWTGRSPTEWVTDTLETLTREVASPGPLHRRRTSRPWASGAARTALLTVRIGPDVRARLKRGADAAGVSLSEWTRHLLVAALPPTIAEEVRAQQEAAGDRDPYKNPRSGGSLDAVITTHVAPEVRAQLAATARRDGLSVAAWSRAVLIDALAGPAELAPDVGGGRRTVTIACTPAERQAVIHAATREGVAPENFVRRHLVAAELRWSGHPCLTKGG
jgi:predicted HicB family RNase H-like nuclease